MPYSGICLPNRVVCYVNAGVLIYVHNTSTVQWSVLYYLWRSVTELYVMTMLGSSSVYTILVLYCTVLYYTVLYCTLKCTLLPMEVGYGVVCYDNAGVLICVHYLLGLICQLRNLHTLDKLFLIDYLHTQYCVKHLLARTFRWKQHFHNGISRVYIYFQLNIIFKTREHKAKRVSRDFTGY